MMGVKRPRGAISGAFYSNFDTFDELFFALYTERSELLARQVAAGLTLPPSDIPGLVAQAVHALMVDRDWILLSTDLRLYAARNPDVAAALRAHRSKLRDALAASLTPAIDRSALPASLQTPDGLARAVMAIHDGATTELLLDNDPARFRSWLADLLTALLEPRQTRTPAPARHPTPNPATEVETAGSGIYGGSGSAVSHSPSPTAAPVPRATSAPAVSPPSWPSTGPMEHRAGYNRPDVP